MRRLRLGLLATLVAAGVAGSAYAATGSATHPADGGAQQARAAEVAPSTPRDVLVGERTGTALLRRLASDRGEPRLDALAASFAVLSTLALAALAARRQPLLRPSRADDTVAVALIPARGPPLRLA